MRGERTDGQQTATNGASRSQASRWMWGAIVGAAVGGAYWAMYSGVFGHRGPGPVSAAWVGAVAGIAVLLLLGLTRPPVVEVAEERDTTPLAQFCAKCVYGLAVGVIVGAVYGGMMLVLGVSVRTPVTSQMTRPEWVVYAVTVVAPTMVLWSTASFSLAAAVSLVCPLSPRVEAVLVGILWGVRHGGMGVALGVAGGMVQDLRARLQSGETLKSRDQEWLAEVAARLHDSVHDSVVRWQRRRS